MNAFFAGMARGMFGGVGGYQYENNGDQPKDSTQQKTNEVGSKGLRSLGEREGGNDNSRDSRMDGATNNSSRDCDSRASSRDIDWPKVVTNTAQGGLNVYSAIKDAKNGNLVQAGAEAILAVDNVVQVGSELSQPVGQALEHIGREINKEDVYWGGLDQK